ncbi:membrane protein insertase YidC [Carnobacteriaceae bacterium zg-C25]|nr:membrane protein insertase YidC [Carnobacteriaceae bacterium zg-C25]
MKNKSIQKLTLFTTLLLLLSGCVSRTANGEPTGWVWDLLGKPMESIIIWFAQLFGGQAGSYGLGIIMVTIIVRIIITPLNLQMTRATTENSEKTTYIKPAMDEINDRLKNAQSLEERNAVQMEMMALQRAAGIKLISAGGCLPIFVQIPIFSALYFATISSNAIRSDVFMGISLDVPSMLLTILSAGAYLIQGLLTQIGMTPEQKQMNRTMILITPIMQLVFASSVPAGAALYWVIGGIVSCFTTLYTNLVQKPRIKEQVAEYMAQNPITLPKRKDITPNKTSETVPAPITNGQRRNEGKQRR